MHKKLFHEAVLKKVIILSLVVFLLSFIAFFLLRLKIYELIGPVLDSQDKEAALDSLYQTKDTIRVVSVVGMASFVSLASASTYLVLTSRRNHR